jgi:TonB-linked SusC/RagA family outer membrane protein
MLKFESTSFFNQLFSLRPESVRITNKNNIMKHVFRKSIFFKALLCSFFIMLSIPVSFVSGQSNPGRLNLNGVVLDENEEPLIGVSVFVPGTNTGVITDFNGKFEISVPNNARELAFSYVGYISRTIQIKNNTTFNVILEESSKELQEIVVVGYGVQKKESSVAAISQVKGDALTKVAATNLSSALAGQVSGVSTVQISGKPGDDNAKIYIRGVSSWQGNDPLVMVDGVERDFDQIDPNEVETISVLKDASATAVFGVRGANGVILITTKRGARGKVKVNVTAEQTMKSPTGIIAPMDSYNTALVMNMAARNDNTFNKLLSDEILQHYKLQDMPYVYPNTNWQEVMLKDMAFSQKYNVNISGGTEFARVFSSITYTSENDILKTEKQALYDPSHRYDKVNYRFNADVDITKTTLLSIDAGGYIGIQNQPYETSSQRLFRPIFTLGPMDIPPYYPESVLDMYPDTKRPEELGRRIATTTITNAENPLVASNYSGSRTQKTSNLNVSLKLNQKLDFITKGLYFKAVASFNNTVAFENTISYNAATYRLQQNLNWDRIMGRTGNMDNEAPIALPVASTETLTGSPFKSWYFEGSLNYNRVFGKHTVTGLIVAQRRKAQSNVNFPSFQQGIASRVTYDFDSKYLLEANLGINGSEQFSPKNRYGIFPSFGVGWNLHHEEFFKPVLPLFSRAKIRSSWGLVGSDAAGSRWLYTSSYSVGGNGTKYRSGTESSPGIINTLILEDAAANANTTWEKAVKKDIGIEFSLLQNQLFVFHIDFFHEHRYDILLNRMSIPDMFGVGMKQQNLGATETQGYEVELKFQQTKTKDLYYWVKTGVNFSDNRIISRDEPLYTPEYQKQEGKRIFQIFGNEHQGLVQNADMLMNSMRYGSGQFSLGDTRWIDFNGDGVIDVNDNVPIGYTTEYPLYTFNLAGGLRYKNFEFDYLFVGVTCFSKIVWDNFRWPLHRLSNQVFEYQLDAWSPTNPDARYPAYRYDVNRTNNTIADGNSNGNAIYDGTFFRLKSVNISYSISKKTTEKLGFGNINFFLRGNNLFTWSPFYPLSDPEASDSGTNLGYGYYPMLRRFQLGTRFTF